MSALQKQKLSGEQDMYKNEARRKGEVDVEIPKDFTDLSTGHTPIGGLFESPKVQPKHWQHTLSQLGAHNRNVMKC